MEPDCRTRDTVFQELAERAPGAPFLALGQTVFWDEPMKSGVVLAARRAGDTRPFVAGVHDTDYFAKFASADGSVGFKALPHNDTTTRGLWSAAGEFSALFGSETVVTRDALSKAGARIAQVSAARPGYLDEVTEAWGWRGVVGLDSVSKVTAEKKLGPMFPELFRTFEWAVDTSLSMVAGPHRADAERARDRLVEMVCGASEAEQGQTLADFYERLLPMLYDLTAGRHVGVETSRTSRLLAFDRETVARPRFDLVRLFVDPSTRSMATKAYDDAVRGTEIYTLDRFGTGALPFDLIIPGVGRGTLRLGNRGGVVMTPDPVGFSFKKPLTSLEDLVDVIERRFGPGCVLVGKAVSLIGMLASEFVFVFHEGASSYVSVSRKFHQALAANGAQLKLNPVLRVRYEPWDAMTDCCTWIKLPEPLHRPFGVDELSAPSFAIRWREVYKEQVARLEKLSKARRTVDIMVLLEQALGGMWSCLASEYAQIHAKLSSLQGFVASAREDRKAVAARIRETKLQVNEIEAEKGRHWRDKVFEKQPSQEDLDRRSAYEHQVDQLCAQVNSLELEWKALLASQEESLASEDIAKAKRRRDSIALEAEIMRMTLVREAIVATDGLRKAAHRPSAWWFPLICPGGAWFNSTMDAAEMWLESVQ
ncbi:MAG: hypothetical protein JSS65_07085 [Armatimonadetes bacterium]|nr:hypothetical protein [Armatimonadota bacterium]